MNRLISGIKQFHKEVFPANRELFRRLASGQNPEALFIACSDSRVSLEWITQSGPGDLFVCRNAGNMVPRYSRTDAVSATIEYAVAALQVKYIVVCGHSDCGAMKALLQPAALTGMPNVKSWLKHADGALGDKDNSRTASLTPGALVALTKANILLQMDHLNSHPQVSSRLREGALEIHGWYYQIHSGEVEAYDAGEERWVAIHEPVERPRIAMEALHA